MPLGLSKLKKKSQCLDLRLERLTLLLGTKASIDLKSKSMFIYCFENAKYYGNLFCLSINETAKLGYQYICLQHGLLNILSPVLLPTVHKTRLLKILLLTDNIPGHSPRVLMKVHVSHVQLQVHVHHVFILANTIHSTALGSRNNFDFNFYYFKNIFYKVIVQ